MMGGVRAAPQGPWLRAGGGSPRVDRLGVRAHPRSHQRPRGLLPAQRPGAHLRRYCLDVAHPHRDGAPTSAPRLVGAAWYTTWDRTCLHHSIARVAELAPTVLAGGHGQPMNGPDTPEALRAFAAARPKTVTGPQKDQNGSQTRSRRQTATRPLPPGCR